MAVGDSLDLLQAKLTEKSAIAPGAIPFDPLGIITAIVAAIQGCIKPTPATLKRRLLNRTLLALQIRRQTGASFGQAYSSADAVFDLADAATEDQLQGLIDDACH